MDKRIRNKMEYRIKLALQWFKDKGFCAHTDDNATLYIIVNNVEIQVSNAEIEYRSELQLNEPMDKRIVKKYVTDVIDQAAHNREEAIEEMTNVLHVALNGNSQQSKALILEALLTIEE